MTNSWDRDLLQKKRPDLELLEKSLLDDARLESEDFFEKHLHLLRSLLFISAAKALFNEESSQTVINAILYRLPSNSFKLAKLYHFLICSLTKTETQISKSELLADYFSENEGWWKIGGVYSPIFLAEMGILFGLIGLVREDRDFIQSSVNIANRQIGFLDKHGFPFLGLWVREKDFAENDLFSLNQLLFSMAQVFTGDESFAALCKNENLSCVAFSTLFDLFKDKTILVEKPIAQKEAATLIIKNKYSFAATLTGCNSGLAALHGEKVRILNIGPQRPPLGDCNLFGIERDLDGLEDIEVEEGEHFKVSGWTKIPVDPNEKDVWIFSNVKATDEGIFVEIKKSTEIPLVMTFFVFAEIAEIAPKKFLKPNSLEKYKGKSSEVAFKTEQEVIKISSRQPLDMELIPLSGNKNFFGATFLLSFNLSRDRDSYRWQILI